MNSCPICDGRLLRRTATHRETIGRFVVTNKSMVAPTCDACGRYFLSGPQKLHAELRAACVVLTDVSQLDGDALGEIRSILDLSVEELSTLLGVQPKDLAAHEKSDEIPLWMRLAVGTLCRLRLEGRPFAPPAPTEIEPVLAVTDEPPAMRCA